VYLFIELFYCDVSLFELVVKELSKFNVLLILLSDLFMQVGEFSIKSSRGWLLDCEVQLFDFYGSW
jgi:hypothetical protein